MSDATDAIADFEEAALEYGVDATLERSSSTTNKRTGAVSRSVVNASLRVLPSKPVSVESEEGLTFRVTEARARSTTEPKVGDTLAFNGSRYRITGLEVVQLQGVVLFYKFLLGPQ